MIEIVINFDQNSKMYKVYEPTSDTLLITSNLSESLIKLSEFLRNSGMIQSDILASDCISYHQFGKSLTSGGFQGNKNKEDKFVSKNKNFFSKSSFKNSLKKFG